MTTIPFEEIEGIEDAVQAQDDIELPAGTPWLLAPDKQRMADSEIPFYLEDITLEEGNPAFNNKKKDPEDNKLWKLVCTCKKDLKFPPIPMQERDQQRGRKIALEIEAGQEFVISLSNSIKREPVMKKLFDACRGKGLPARQLGPLQLYVYSYFGNGTAFLSVQGHK